MHSWRILGRKGVVFYSTSCSPNSLKGLNFLPPIVNCWLPAKFPPFPCNFNVLNLGLCAGSKSFSTSNQLRKNKQRQKSSGWVGDEKMKPLKSIGGFKSAQEEGSRSASGRSFDELFKEKNWNSVGPQNIKVSPDSSQHALFKENLDEIRRKRYEIDPDVDTASSPLIEKLSQDELDIIRKVFQRVDPDKKIAPRLESRGHYIDPYWDPFEKIGKLEGQVAYEFNEYSKLVSASESRRQRLFIRRSLKAQQKIYDPFTNANAEHFHRKAKEPFPVPKMIDEHFWDPSPDMRVVLRNNNRPISWRDTHVLHHFIGENGMILPRRLTKASRYQQKQIFKAICIGRAMGLFPLDWKPSEAEKMPIMDPIQFLVDELTHRYIVNGDLRAQAMIKVLLERYPDVNFLRFIKYESTKNEAGREENNEEDRGDPASPSEGEIRGGPIYSRYPASSRGFSDILNSYKGR